MDEPARCVLKLKKDEIGKNLIVCDKILSHLEQETILTEDMVQEIQAQSTTLRKVNQLLYILTRRGEKAFSAFISALQQDYEFLAEILQEEYRKQLQKSSIKESSPRSCEVATSPINSLPAIDNNTAHRLRSNTNQSNGSFKSISQSDHSSHSTIHSQHQQQLVELHSILKSHLVNRNIRELTFASPTPVTYQSVQGLVVELIQNVEECYRILHVDNKVSLTTHFIHVKESKRKLKEDLQATKEKMKQFNENYIKLEKSYRDCKANYQEKEHLADQLSEQLALQQEEVTVLRENETKLLNENKAMQARLKVLEEENEALKKQDADNSKPWNKGFKQISGHKMLKFQKQQKQNFQEEWTGQDRKSDEVSQRVSKRQDRHTDAMSVRVGKREDKHFDEISPRAGKRQDRQIDDISPRAGKRQDRQIDDISPRVGKRQGLSRYTKQQRKQFHQAEVGGQGHVQKGQVQLLVVTNMHTVKKY